MKGTTLIVASLFCSNSWAQDLVTVSEGVMKVAGMGEEILYFGFAEGDKIIFSFKEQKGKELKEIEIIAYPEAVKYSNFKAESANTEITVHKEGVYKFRFKNGRLGKRVCEYSIQRLPASEETRKFNTSVKWVLHTDTTWKTETRNVVVGHDTTYINLPKKVVDSVYQKEEMLLEKTERVHSQSNSNGNKSSLFFTLPANENSGLESQKVVAWAFWVGVGEEANKAWKENAKTLSNLSKGIATFYLTPLGALAVGAITDLAIPKRGEDIYYALTSEANRQLFLNNQSYRIYDEGKGVAGYRKFVNEAMCQGTYFICMSNDNVVTGLDVTVRVVAIVETTVYREEINRVPIVTPIKEKQIFTEPQITQSKIPVVVK